MIIKQNQINSISSDSLCLFEFSEKLQQKTKSLAKGINKFFFKKLIFQKNVCFLSKIPNF
jgi:hypothetical protein